MPHMAAIVSEFVEEGGRKADQLEQDLIHLEKHPGSRETVNEMFRALHTIKGASSFLGFTKLCGLAHSGEKLLARLREGTLTSSPETINALFSLIDAIREILAQVASSGGEGDNDYAVLAAVLAELHKAP